MNADELLRRVAGPLSRLQWPVFYVGGATTHLYITDPLAPTPTATNDVDIVVAVYGRVEYQVELRNELIKIAREDTSEDSPHGRWILNGIKVDIMTPSANVLGFTNIWYEEAIRHPVEVNLSDGATIQCIAASYFVATKAEAFKARGNGDFLGSKDLEDIIAVVDGRPELVGESKRPQFPCKRI